MSETNKYDFTEYAFSKDVTKDFPELIMAYEMFLKYLYQHAQYTGVWSSIQAIEDSKILLELQYSYYKNVYDKKGRISERK